MATEAKREMHETILIAGDDRGVSTILRQALERAGYITAEAVDGNETVAVTHFMQFDLLITVEALRPQSGGKPKLLDTVRAVLAS